VSAWKDTKQEKKNPLATTETIKRIGKSLFKKLKNRENNKK
jgi:hypothetical protein